MPRLLYGLEAIRLTNQGITKLETFHSYALRCILGLPQYTATASLYIITGEMPIENQLDIRYLSFLQSLLSVQPCRDIVLRQYVTKSPKSNSLINTFRDKLYKYGLPTIYELYVNTPTKEVWKKMVKTAVIAHVEEMIWDAASQKSTLTFLEKSFHYRETHPVVGLVENSRQVTRANVKTRLLTKTYPIQETRHRVKRANNPSCLLCQHHSEDTLHFILKCPALDETRQRYLTVHGTQPDQQLL